MKLINKITFSYLAITLVVLFAGGALVFYSVQREIKKDNEGRLEGAVKYTAENLQKGIDAGPLPDINVFTRELRLDAPVVKLHFSDSAVYFPPHQHNEAALFASASYKFGRNHYLITASTLTSEPDEIWDGVKKSLSWIFIALLVFITISSLLISRKIFAPFNKSLQKIQSFNLQQQKEAHFPASTTKEFEQLNRFLEQMTKKAVNDYRSLKEFTENASHELQTPLAVIRGKLELMMETDIQREQSVHLAAAYNAVQHLATVHESLALITRLDNQEYRATESINFSQVISEMLGEFTELAAIRSITVKDEITENISLHINRTLSRILVANLLSNAIKYNYADGKIWVKLSAKQLIVSNTGPAPEVAPGQLFGRFKKGNQSNDSVGLGLAIVHQICILNHFSANYGYENERHILTITFHS